MPNEIYDAEGNYKGYLKQEKDGSWTVVDSKKGGLGGATQMASAKLAKGNIAEQNRIRNEKKYGKYGR